MIVGIASFVVRRKGFLSWVRTAYTTFDGLKAYQTLSVARSESP